MRVSIFCWTKFHAFHLAHQLHQRGMLQYLVTSFYGKFGNKHNDRGTEIPRSKIRTNLLCAALAYGYNPFSELQGHQIFGNWASRHVGDEDIVVTWGLSALPVIQAAQKRGNIAIVERGSAHAAVQRDLLLREYEEFGQPTTELMRSFSPERMERELLEYALADYIEVPSSFAKRSFVAQGIPAWKILKTPLGVDLSLFNPLPKPDHTFRVIYTGHMSLRKGVHYLLQAFAELNLPDAELWLFGSHLPEIEPFFQKYVGKYRHFGPVPQHTLSNYYAHGDVFAICSIEEGMATVQPQAMACGLPVICTTNTGGEDIINDGIEGFIIPIRSVEAIKEKILYLYEQRDLCAAMGQAALQRVQTGLTWDDVGARAVDTYRACLSRTATH
jgi:glycosyltransferase involved in cell wall biosynthesis